MWRADIPVRSGRTFVSGRRAAVHRRGLAPARAARKPTDKNVRRQRTGMSALHYRRAAARPQLSLISCVARPSDCYAAIRSACESCSRLSLRPLSLSTSRQNSANAKNYGTSLNTAPRLREPTTIRTPRIAVKNAPQTVALTRSMPTPRSVSIVELGYVRTNRSGMTSVITCHVIL
jgi:hypothetical protein